MSTKRKAPGKLAPPTVRANAKRQTRAAIDESRTAVAATDIVPSQAETIELSSDAGSDEEDLSDEEAEAPKVNGDVANHVNGTTKADQLPSPNDSDPDSDGEETSPTFGELLRSNDAIDVPALLQQSSTDGAAPVARRSRTIAAPPSHNSLTTVLSQALRTDDADLLESCLQTTDLATVHKTIENIDSALAGTLLTKLASRLYRRPGRAGSLTAWVQWTIIAHSGALASQPQVLQSMSGLQKVLSERSKGLGSLLALKGKLDLLEGQMKLRRHMQISSALVGDDDEDSGDEDVVYVEGETEGANTDGRRSNGLLSRRKRLGAGVDDDEDDDDDDEAVMNGVDDSSDEDGAEEEEEESDEEESLDEDEVDHDDVDESMGEEEDSDAEAAPPAKMQKTSKAFSKRK